MTAQGRPDGPSRMSVILPDPRAPEPRRVGEMFDRLAAGYDAFNGLASLGLDRVWRRALVRGLGPSGEGTVLDLGTGTGDLLFDALKRSPRPRTLLGLDLSLSMLLKASEKCRPAGGAFFLQAGADRLPVISETADAVVSAFVLRNVKTILKGVLSEIRRVLKPGGTVLLLEMYAPENAALRALHRLYLRTVLPAAGRAAFGRRWSGDYLPETIFHFGTPGQFSDRLREAGFREVSFRRLSGGIAALHSAKK